jgi:hypothetical protein
MGVLLMRLLRNASIGRKFAGALALMILLAGLLGANSLRGLRGCTRINPLLWLGLRHEPA